MTRKMQYKIPFQYLCRLLVKYFPSLLFGFTCIFRIDAMDHVVRIIRYDIRLQKHLGSNLGTVRGCGQSPASFLRLRTKKCCAVSLYVTVTIDSLLRAWNIPSHAAHRRLLMSRPDLHFTLFLPIKHTKGSKKVALTVPRDAVSPGPSRIHLLPQLPAILFSLFPYQPNTALKRARQRKLAVSEAKRTTQ